MNYEERLWMDQVNYKLSLCESMDQYIPPNTLEGERKDVAHLAHCMVQDGELPGWLISAACESYTRLFAHHIVSVQPFVREFSTFFLAGDGDDGGRVSSHEVKNPASAVNFSFRWLPEKAADDEMKANAMVRMARGWDQWVVDKLCNLAGLQWHVLPGHSPTEQAMTLVDEVSQACGQPVTWMIVRPELWEDFVRQGAGVEFYESARQSLFAISYGTWDGVRVYIATLPTGVLALCGYKGNTTFDAGLAVCPDLMATIDANGDYISTYFNSKFRQPGHGLVGFSACGLSEGGELMYGVLRETPSINKYLMNG